LRPTEIRRIKCNSPADCCRRGLDRAEPLSSPVAKMQTNLWRVMPPCGKNANESTAGHAALRQKCKRIDRGSCRLAAKHNGGSKPPPYTGKRIATRVGTGLPDGPQKHSQQTVEDAGPYRFAMTCNMIAIPHPGLSGVGLFAGIPLLYRSKFFCFF